METETNTQNFSQKPPVFQVGAFFWDLFKILVIAFAIIIPFRTFIAEPFVVSGSSMVPNFHDKDYLVIDRISYLAKEDPKRGDVVVLKFPKDTSQYFIKRIIGLPGERVAFQSGDVYIFNKERPEGFRLDESYIPKGVETLGQSNNLTLGTDEFFVLGDNRTQSSDSRVWGILPREDIVGKVFLRVLPPKNFGTFKQPQY